MGPGCIDETGPRPADPALDEHSSRTCGTKMLLVRDVGMMEHTWHAVAAYAARGMLELPVARKLAGGTPALPGDAVPAVRWGVSAGDFSESCFHGLTPTAKCGRRIRGLLEPPGWRPGIFF